MAKNCLNCEHFTWWDGDYCCTKNFIILGKSNENWDFTEDIVSMLKTFEDCIDWKKSKSEFHTELYKEKYHKFLIKNKNLV